MRVRALAYLGVSSLGGILPDVDHLTVLEAVVGPRGLHHAFLCVGIVCLGIAVALLFGLLHQHRLGGYV